MNVTADMLFWLSVACLILGIVFAPFGSMVQGSQNIFDHLILAMWVGCTMSFMGCVSMDYWKN